MHLSLVIRILYYNKTINITTNTMTNSNSNSAINELKIYVGEMISYKGRALRVSDVTPKGAMIFEPLTGNAATITVEEFAELIRMKHVTMK